MVMIFRAKTVTAMAAAAAAIALTACGSSSKPGSTATTTGSTSASTSATGSTQVSGTPYKLMWTENASSGADKYVSAIEKGVNARGGIAGHPLQIVVCADNYDANQATQCARQATSDSNMLGVIGNYSTCSSQLLPLLQQAHMASIGDDFFCPEDFKSPQVFPFNGGTFTTVGAAAIGIKYFNNPNVVVTTVDQPAGREFPPLVQNVVGPAGGKVLASVYVPITTADMAPYAQQIAAQPGVLLEGNTVQVGVRLAQALNSLGYKEPVIYTAVVWYSAIFKNELNNPTNAYLAQFYNESSAGWKLFVSDMSKYAPGATYQGDDLVTTWLAANVVAQIAKTMPTVSASAIFNYLTNATALNTFGMTPPLNFTVPQKALGGIIPRAVYPDVALYHYVNGTAVQVTPFENVLP
jgi:ABC-type branched-subunit amino acid transport system substrate-binding protein